MRKIIYVLMLLFLSSYLQSYTIFSIKGQQNIQKVIKSKPIYVVFTAYKVQLWDKSLEAWVKSERAKGKNVRSFSEMKNAMYKNFAGPMKFKGKKWEMQMIKSISSAKKGYVLHINVDKVIPAPPVGLTARYTIRAYKAGSKKYLFDVKMKITQNAGLFLGSLPRDCLPKSGKMLSEEFYGFMRRGK